MDIFGSSRRRPVLAGKQGAGRHPQQWIKKCAGEQVEGDFNK
jgi:hypothetical protein